MGGIISRFAPAPTGFLHLGHVVNAIYVWGLMRLHGGRVLVRIEDHDRVRSRREFEAAILEDLEWLGFSGDEPPVRQSERGDIYLQALDALRRHDLVYACDCSRAQIAGAQRHRPIPSGVDRPSGADELWYPGTCRDRRVEEKPGVGLRVRLEPSTERFDDLRHGPQLQRPFEQCGDLLVRDRDGNWTYQFAATVDDYVQNVTMVIRGDDLLASTGRQLRLARLIGRTRPPRFLHHALVMKSVGDRESAGTGESAGSRRSTAVTQKLSKSDADSGVRDLRTRGWTAARVIGDACARAGLIAEARDVAADEVSSMMGAFREALL